MPRPTLNVVSYQGPNLQTYHAISALWTYNRPVWHVTLVYCFCSWRRLLADRHLGGGGGGTAFLSLHGIQCHLLSSLTSMQHQFCRRDHMCKEFSCGPLWQKGTTEPATNYVNSVQIPAVAQKMCSGSRNSHSKFAVQAGRRTRHFSVDSLVGHRISGASTFPL